tara:strand:- start:494 stop:871 length:378 start_codon:yes stop_codon:yes gene_type:complete
MIQFVLLCFFLIGRCIAVTMGQFEDYARKSCSLGNYYEGKIIFTCPFTSMFTKKQILHLLDTTGYLHFKNFVYDRQFLLTGGFKDYEYTFSVPKELVEMQTDENFSFKLQYTFFPEADSPPEKTD